MNNRNKNRDADRTMCSHGNDIGQLGVSNDAAFMMRILLLEESDQKSVLQTRETVLLLANLKLTGFLLAIYIWSFVLQS